MAVVLLYSPPGSRFNIKHFYLSPIPDIKDLVNNGEKSFIKLALDDLQITTWSDSDRKQKIKISAKMGIQ